MDHYPVLERARELLDEIYRLTDELCFSGKKENERDEAEAFADLVEEREILISEMTELRGELNDEARATPEFADIMKRITEIGELDKRNQIHIKRIHDNMRYSIKEAKTARHVSDAYNTGAADDHYRYVDTKK
ncbi:MAG: hypothetical protein FWE90_10170 [Defluviitaleaceae bacterium]|nr:hypothetical protein [Defluviitaleaceae bacterium]